MQRITGIGGENAVEPQPRRTVARRPQSQGLPAVNRVADLLPWNATVHNPQRRLTRSPRRKLAEPYGMSPTLPIVSQCFEIVKTPHTIFENELKFFYFFSSIEPAKFSI